MKKSVRKSSPAHKVPPKVDFVKYVGPAIFATALILNLNYSLTGITNYLLENHSFRQTQTALTSYYFCKDGFKLAYETPVVGAPWTIPFEFPFYQWLVSIIKNITSANLDVIGRLVSLFFFYASLFYVFKIAQRYTKNTGQSLFILSFILLHPIYIFWSRTFMIESTALFFCVAYLCYALDYLETKNISFLLLATVAGLLASLEKITTLIPFCIVLFALISCRWFRNDRLNSRFWGMPNLAVQGILLFILPFIAIKLWTDFADHLRSLNHYAYDFTSSTTLNKWTFGTVEQKTSLKTWQQIFEHSHVSSFLFYLLILATIVWSVVAKHKYWKESLVCLGLYLSAPLIFTNLHYVHDYYTYSNSFMLSAAVGFSCLSLLETKGTLIKVMGVVIAAGVLFFFIGRYKESYYKVQVRHPNYAIPTSNLVKETTKPDEVIMVYGNDWGSEYAYYTERRTIALRNTFKSVKDASFAELMKQNKDYNITTLVFVSYAGLFDRNFLNELIAYLGFKPILQKEPFWVFQKENNK